MALVKKEFGELLIDNGLITPQEWSDVLLEHEKTNEPISTILNRLGLATENQVKNALELRYGVNYVDLAKFTAPSLECLDLVPETIIRTHLAIPVAKDGNRVTIAMVNPNNLAAIDDVKMRLKGMQVKVSVCTEDAFQHFMETVYNKYCQENANKEMQASDAFIDQEIDLSQLDFLRDLDLQGDKKDKDLDWQAEDAPIVNLANQILAKAIQNKVSDIHIEPQEKALVIRLRKDGVLIVDRQLPQPITPAVVSRFKIMADLDIAERRLPQDGRIRVKLHGKDIEFRVSTLPSKFGEKVVMRILDKSNINIVLKQLITDKNTLASIQDMIQKPYGIIFVTGPTGSGKTTTLYAALSERNTPEVNIVTAEDPIEYDLAGITQVQVLREKGLDFARILRAFLRQDPDIMLIGETRDKETAKIAVEAALTGHLVFTTLHTNDAPGAITRLSEMEVEPFLVASATIGVVAQRLVRKICSDCKESYVPDTNTLEYLNLIEKNQETMTASTVQLYGFEINDHGLPIFYRGKGCESCSGSGYRGRVGCYEVMKLHDEIRDLICKGASTAMLRFAAKQAGMITLKDYSLRLVAQGLTTPQECIRVTISDTQGEDTLCPKCRNPIGDDFLRCPFCQFELKKSCVRCGALQEESWAACAKCGLAKEEALLDHACSNCGGEIYGSWSRCPYCQRERFYRSN